MTTSSIEHAGSETKRGTSRWAGQMIAALEAQTLQAELSGYSEYTQSVHARLLPGLW